MFLKDWKDEKASRYNEYYENQIDCNVLMVVMIENLVVQELQVLATFFQNEFKRCLGVRLKIETLTKLRRKASLHLDFTKTLF